MPKKTSPTTAKRSDRIATETALMDAALRLLRRDGVLAGLNTQEVADEAVANRALIHRYFGGRRGLLRAALDSRKRAMAHEAAMLKFIDPAKRSVSSFPAFAKDPTYAEIVMLLALDGDEQFDPMPYFAETLADIQREKESGIWVEDTDLLALSVIVHVLVYGYFVMRGSVARQLGMSVRTLDRRIEAAMARITQAFLRAERE